MNSGVGDYDLCGWRVASAITLPDLPHWTGDDRAADVVIAIGEALPLDAPTMTTPLVAIDAMGRARFSVAGVADYLVEGGRRITVAPVGSAHSPDVRLFLLGSGLGYLCHQRGVLPIHGATIAIDGEAVILAGPSGIGKSTLADAFARRGHVVLSDDVSPVQVGAQGALVLPSVRRIRLWRDAIDNARWDSGALEQCREGLEKYSRSLKDQPPLGPLPSRAIFHLRRQWDKHGGASFRRLRGRAAGDEFYRQVYRWRSLVGIAGESGAMARALQAAAGVPHHFIVERALSFDRLEAAVDDIVATVRASR